MADPHAEEPRGGSEAEVSVPNPGGDAPNLSAPPGRTPPEASSAAGTDPNDPTGPATTGSAQKDTRRPAQDPAGRKGSPPLALRLRRAHAALAPWVLAPLLLTVTTGLAYRLLRDWGGLGRDPAHGLMVLHEGEWLRHWFGPSGETFYVLTNGLGLLWMLGTGGAMLWQGWHRPGDRGDT